jgi:hypothetical protein
MPTKSYSVLAAGLLLIFAVPAMAAQHVISPNFGFGVNLSCQIRRSSQNGSEVWLYNPASPVHAGTAIQVTDNTGRSAVFTTTVDIPPTLNKHNFPLIGERCTARTTLLTVLAPPER